MKVIILGGGNSPEREVSLRSASAVADAARKAGFDVQEEDPADGLGFLDDLGKSDVVLPILHGKGGEDGLIQKEFEDRNLIFLGSGSSSSARCFDKWLTRQDLLKSELPIPEGALVTHETYRQHEFSQKPHVLKVARGGSSIGTLIVRDSRRVTELEVVEIFKLDRQAVLEELIVGTELTVPILDQKALTPIEIKPPDGLEFNYENKYNGATAELCPPASVSQEVQDRAKLLAEQVHQVMKCRHLSRIDMIVDKAGDIKILEINTMPGLTGQSLYPKSAAVAGLDMSQLVTRFVELATRDGSA
ncbi:D-alanine--D-alanine ligase [Candidatus Saccharibacteria bacterium]|nr:D-alanine--D-alanine ligase [Candidatus Saccharibacteria bacterium]